MNAKVDDFMLKLDKWSAEMKLLRDIVLDCGLTEELKWGAPCYTHNGRNVVLIHAFKEYCALLFFKGALLLDEAQILIQQTEHVQAGRQIRFTSEKDIQEKVHHLRAYIFEAVEVEKAGLQVELKKTSEFAVPTELETKFAELPELQTAFEGLTPGRRRAYLLHFSEPKQSKTRIARIEKYLPKIMAGKGLHD